MASHRLETSEVGMKEELIKNLNDQIEILETLQNENVPFDDNRVITARSLFSVTAAEATSFVEDTASRLRSEWDDKSERWQESDRGSEVDDFISTWESAEINFEDEVTENPDLEMFRGIVEALEELEDGI